MEFQSCFDMSHVACSAKELVNLAGVVSIGELSFMNG